MKTAIVADRQSREQPVAYPVTDFESDIEHQQSAVLHGHHGGLKDAVVIECTWGADIQNGFAGGPDDPARIVRIQIHETDAPDVVLIAALHVYPDDAAELHRSGARRV